MSGIRHGLLSVACIVACVGCDFSRPVLSHAQFIEAYFGPKFPTSSLEVSYVHKSAIGGEIAIARVSGPTNQVRLFLESKGIREFEDAESTDILEILLMRTKELAKERSNTILPDNFTNTVYMWRASRPRNDMAEYYVATDYSHFIIIDGKP